MEEHSCTQPQKAKGQKVQFDGTQLEMFMVDWEFAGWYPSYWEYSRAIFACGRWEDDWSLWMDKILEPFRAEYAWVQLLLDELCV